jgi:hypothetical protein
LRKNFRKSAPDFSTFDAPRQGDVGKPEHKLESLQILHPGVALKIAGIGFDGIIQAGGQFDRRFDFGGAQVFDHYARRCAISGTDIHEWRLAGGADGVVIDDYIGHYGL